jgi:hypothetical protein
MTDDRRQTTTTTTHFKSYWKTLYWGGKGGGNTEGAPKKDFGYFLEIANVGEAYLIFEKISVLPKVYSKNRPNRLKILLKVFWQFKHF